MHRLTGIILLVLLSGGTSPASADHAPVPEFEAEYALYYNGMKVARIQRQLTSPQDGEYLYHSETETTGLVSLFRKDHIIEVSQGQINGNTLRPMQYRYTRTGSKRERDVAVNFDWQENQVTNQINGHEWDMELRPGILDKLVYQFIIMKDLPNSDFPLTYTIADGGKVKDYHFEKRGTEIIDTPIGKLETVKIVQRKSNSDRELILWCAPQLHYLPVKVLEIDNDDDDETVALINSLQGLDPGAPQVTSQK